MNNLWTDTGYISLNHVNEQLCGDRVEIIGNNEKSLTMVLADGASQIAQLLFEYATDINFFIGKAINPAHQNPDLPITFGIKIRLVQELSEYLEKMGKQIKVSYF